jgi:hypothetical protein
MKWYAARWFLVGIGAVVVLGAVGSVILALRRGIMPADDGATLALPVEDKADSVERPERWRCLSCASGPARG